MKHKDSILEDYYNEQRKKILADCTSCGLCVQKCPVIKNTKLKDVPAADIQQDVLAFLHEGIKKDTVYPKAFACMECFQCVNNFCPQGLTPLNINEIIKWDYRRNGMLENSFQDPRDPEAAQRVLASIQVSRDEYQKILTPTNKEKAKYVFFPGCNVYFQPEKILTALDIINLITADYAFVPGLDYCCGDVSLYSGYVEKGGEAAEKLGAKLASYQPETVIFWCPTCLCRFQETLSLVHELPFNIISFPQFLSQNIDKLPFKKRIEKKVTLHEACKAAYTGADLNGPRDLLRKIPGVDLVEMLRHGKNTACCGSGALDFFPEVLGKIRDERLNEAALTKAEILVDICQSCHSIFISEEAQHNFSIVNYVSLVGEALGIEREDKYKKYKQWGDIEKILEDAKKFCKASPYSSMQIINALQQVIA